MAQSTPRIGEVAQHHAFGSCKPVSSDEVGKRHGVFQHIAHDGLRRDIKFPRPRMPLAIGFKSRIEFFPARHWPSDFFDDFHALGVIDAFSFQSIDFLASRCRLLSLQQLARVIQNSLER